VDVGPPTINGSTRRRLQRLSQTSNIVLNDNSQQYGISPCLKNNIWNFFAFDSGTVKPVHEGIRTDSEITVNSRDTIDFSTVLFSRGSAKHVMEFREFSGFLVLEGECFLPSVCWCVIMKFFRSPCRIQTPSRSVSYTGGRVQVQITEQQIWRAVSSLVHCCAIKKNVIVS